MRDNGTLACNATHGCYGRFRASLLKPFSQLGEVDRGMANSLVLYASALACRLTRQHHIPRRDVRAATARTVLW